jgi:hypothetical protein
MKKERVKLEDVRRGQFEALLCEMATVPGREPDYGDPRCHPTAGATAIGARNFLIAYNINLNTSDVAIARSIARSIRFSSGGLPAVKAMGVMLATRNLAQVSMNLVNFDQTPMHVVFEAVQREAERHGVTISGSEIVGLVPRKAMEACAAHFLNVENFRAGMILENRIAEATEAEPTMADLLQNVDVRVAGSIAAATSAALAARLFPNHAEAFHDDCTFFLHAPAGSDLRARARVLAARLEKLSHTAVSNAELLLAKSLADAVAQGSSGSEPPNN